MKITQVAHCQHRFMSRDMLVLCLIPGNGVRMCIVRWASGVSVYARVVTPPPLQELWVGNNINKHNEVVYVHLFKQPCMHA